MSNIRSTGPCHVPTCPKHAVKNGLCEEHGKSASSLLYKRRAPGGYDQRWRKYSKFRLAQFPFCVVCGRGATETDHIKPVYGPGDPLFWDENNHQSLCHKCHSTKTWRELGMNTDKKGGD